MHRNKIDMPRTKRLTRRAFALYAALVLVCCCLLYTSPSPRDCS